MKTSEIIARSAVAILFVLPHQASARSPDDLAKQTQNPIASLISVPLQGNWILDWVPGKPLVRPKISSCARACNDENV